MQKTLVRYYGKKWHICHEDRNNGEAFVDLIYCGRNYDPVGVATHKQEVFPDDVHSIIRPVCKACMKEYQQCVTIGVER